MECQICHKEVIRTSNSKKYCKECSKKYHKENQKKCAREWYQLNKERKNEYYKKNYKPHPRPKLLVHKQYYEPRSKNHICKKCGIEFIRNNPSQKHCDLCSKINKKEYQKQYSKKYRQTYLGKVAYRKLVNKRRAKLNSVKEKFTMEEWLKKVDDTNGLCPGYKCKPHFVGKEKLNMDHIIPISKAPEGFVYTINDVSPLCRRCNRRKSDK